MWPIGEDEIKRLRDSEELCRALFDTMAEGFCVIEKVETAPGETSDYRFLAVNPAFERLTGLEGAVGKTVRQFVPDWQLGAFAHLDRVVATGSPAQFEERVEARGTWLEAKAFRSRPGQVGVLFSDVTSRKQTERALRESEARASGLVEDIRQATWETNAAGEVVVDSPSWRAYTGQSLDEWLGYGWTRAIHPDDRADAERQWRAAVAAAHDVNAEFRLRHAGTGTWRWTNMRAVPLVRGDGSIEKWIGMNIDIHDRKQAEEALRISEERVRAFGEASPDVLWIRDAASLRWVYVTPAAEQVYGLGHDEALARDSFDDWLEMIEPEDRPRVREHIARVVAGERVSFEYRIRRPVDRELRWLRSTNFPIRGDGGEVRLVGGIGRDVTEAQRASERQAVLLAELQHRVRNVLAMIRSIARRSAERADAVEDYAQHLEGRIDAMARTQALLTRSPGARVDLASLILDEFAAQSAQEPQYRISGPDIDLTPKAAEVLTLAIHELATNATKYGALAEPNGRISICWIVDPGPDGDWVRLSWTETGVRTAKAMGRPGFGTELLTRRIPYELRGRGAMELRAHGLHATVEFPLGATEDTFTQGDDGAVAQPKKDLP